MELHFTGMAIATFTVGAFFLTLVIVGQLQSCKMHTPALDLHEAPPPKKKEKDEEKGTVAAAEGVYDPSESAGKWYSLDTGEPGGVTPQLCCHALINIAGVCTQARLTPPAQVTLVPHAKRPLTACIACPLLLARILAADCVFFALLFLATSAFFPVPPVNYFISGNLSLAGVHDQYDQVSKGFSSTIMTIMTPEGGAGTQDHGLLSGA